MDEESKELFKSNDIAIKNKYKNLLCEREKYQIVLLITIVFLLLLKNYNYYKYYLFTNIKNKGFNRINYNHNNQTYPFSINIKNETTSNNSYINKHLINKTVNIVNNNINIESFNSRNSFINNEIFINISFILIFKVSFFDKIINFNSRIKEKITYTNNNNNRGIIKIINIQDEIKNGSEIYKNEMFRKNETINIKIIQEEILGYKNNSVNLSFENKEIFYKRDNPKITIIITIYNQKQFIKTIYSCIQNQSFKDLEILFIDDNSMDDSFKLINELMKEDKRIEYIKNTKNKGQFYSRYVGIKKAKGDYLLVIDPDDLLLNNILNKSYDLARYYDLDIVHYYHMKGNFSNNAIRKMNFSGIYYNEQVKNIYFNCSYRYLWDKLIKKDVYIKSIEFIKEKYRNSRIIIHNDEVACFGVFRVAKSYGVLAQIGYFYNRENSNSITKFNFKPENINGRFNTLFTIMEFYFEQTENNTFEKTMGGYNFFELKIRNIYYSKIKYLTNGFIYINNIIDLYLNSSFFNKKQRYNLKRFKYKINIQKLKILNSFNI